jgi:hypothetical protein
MGDLQNVSLANFIAASSIPAMTCGKPEKPNGPD